MISRGLALVLLLSAALACGRGKQQFCHVEGKAIDFGANSRSGVNCVCDGPTTLHCVDVDCRGSWCVPLGPDANPRAGDYRLTTSDIAEALAFCTYDTGGDPGLVTIAEFGYFEHLDCSDR